MPSVGQFGYNFMHKYKIGDKVKIDSARYIPWAEDSSVSGYVKSEWENNPVAEIILLEGHECYKIKTPMQYNYSMLERWMLPIRKPIVVLK